LFFIGELKKKKRIQNSKFKNKVIFEAFNPQRCEKQNGKICQIFILGFQCVAKYKKMIKDLYFIFG